MAGEGVGGRRGYWGGAGVLLVCTKSVSVHSDLLRAYLWVCLPSSVSSPKEKRTRRRGDSERRTTRRAVGGVTGGDRRPERPPGVDGRLGRLAAGGAGGAGWGWSTYRVGAANRAWHSRQGSQKKSIKIPTCLQQWHTLCCWWAMVGGVGGVGFGELSGFQDYRFISEQI